MVRPSIAGRSSSVNEKVLPEKIPGQFLSQHLQICLGCEGKREAGEGRCEELEEKERKSDSVLTSVMRDGAQVN